MAPIGSKQFPRDSPKAGGRRARHRGALREPAVPTLFRFLIVVGILAALGYGALWTLAHWVEPDQREITVTIPSDRLGK